MATITMSLAQNRKTIPWRVAQDLRAPVADSDLVAMSGVDNIRADETQDYQNRQYSKEQKRDHESLLFLLALITCIARDLTLQAKSRVTHHS